jgi:hypothetical protein
VPLFNDYPFCLSLFGLRAPPSCCVVGGFGGAGAVAYSHEFTPQVVTWFVAEHTYSFVTHT